MPEDEIDLDSGFLILPQAIPQEAAPIVPDQPIVHPGGGGATGSGGTAPEGGSSGTGGQPSGGPIKEPEPVTETSVQLRFSTDRNGLFTAWNAIANLADLAGTVDLTIRADAAGGFDKAKLQNGVMEPLREADLIE